MKRWGISWGILLVLLVPGAAAAGGAGSVRLARPLERVAAGESVLYFQALQHNVHPLGDATVTVKASGPDGKSFEVGARIDPAFGENHVYQARLPLEAVGPWHLTIEAAHSIFFPPLTLAVEVLAAGASAPDPGPVKPYVEAGAGHSHGEVTAREPAEPGPVPSVEGASASVPAAIPAQAASPWALGAGAAAVAAAAGLGIALGLFQARRRPGRL